MYRVTLESEEYGVEEFRYPTLRDAREAVARLSEECVNAHKRDGVERRIVLHIPARSADPAAAKEEAESC